MIEALKSDDIVNKMGGRFKLAVLVQKRLVDVTFGAPLLVDRGNKTLMEAVIQEVLEGKITLELPERKRAAAMKAAPAEEEDQKEA
ncbi:MAG: DNA-directed RNA polymerase subunit omega [Planctomycetes bacterium]|nr:DNA-directed RNA polymerase subunit omega [Planctomycetota bacterium]